MYVVYKTFMNESDMADTQLSAINLIMRLGYSTFKLIRGKR